MMMTEAVHGTVSRDMVCGNTMSSGPDFRKFPKRGKLFFSIFFLLQYDNKYPILN